MNKQGIFFLESILKKAWTKYTAKGEWREDVPCLNQCAVTALVVQDFFGGDILRCKMTDGDSHYYNCIDGEIVDLTKDQLNVITATLLRDTTITKSRQYILSFPDTMRRYAILLHNIALILQNNGQDSN